MKALLILGASVGIGCYECGLNLFPKLETGKVDTALILSISIVLIGAVISAVSALLYARSDAYTYNQRLNSILRR